MVAALNATRTRILREATEIFQEPDEWMETKNVQLGGKSPNEMIAAGKAQLVHELLQAIKYGVYS